MTYNPEHFDSIDPAKEETMALPITETRVAFTRQESDDGESRVTYAVHEFNRFLTDAEATEWVKDRYPSTRCQHEHDCCGNFYASNATWTRVEHYGDLEILLVRQGWDLNI